MSLPMAGGLVVLFAGAAMAAGGGGHGDSSAQWWDLLWRVLNFAVLVGALVFLLRKPVKAALSGRSDAIKDELEDLERKKAEAEQALSDAEARLKDIEAQQAEIIDGFVRAGETEKERIVQAAEKSAERIKALADMTISQEIKRAREELLDEIAEKSAAMAEDLLKSSITKDDQKRLVGEYLDKVSEG